MAYKTALSPNPEGRLIKISVLKVHSENSIFISGSTYFVAPIQFSTEKRPSNAYQYSSLSEKITCGLNSNTVNVKKCRHFVGESADPSRMLGIWECVTFTIGILLLVS